MNTYAQKGQYGFRIEMSDFSGNTVRAPYSSMAGLGEMGMEAPEMEEEVMEGNL